MICDCGKRKSSLCEQKTLHSTGLAHENLALSGKALAHVTIT